MIHRCCTDHLIRARLRDKPLKEKRITAAGRVGGLVQIRPPRLVTFVGSESALVVSELAFVSGASALKVFDRPSFLARLLNGSLFELNR